MTPERMNWAIYRLLEEATALSKAVGDDHHARLATVIGGALTLYIDQDDAWLVRLQEAACPVLRLYVDSNSKERPS